MVVWDCNKLVNKIIRLWYQCRRPRCLYQITIYRVINLCDILIVIFFNSIHDCMFSLTSSVMSYIIVFEPMGIGLYSKTFSLISYRIFRSYFFRFRARFLTILPPFPKMPLFLLFYSFLHFTKLLSFSSTFDFSCTISINTVTSNKVLSLVIRFISRILLFCLKSIQVSGHFPLNIFTRLRFQSSYALS